MKRKSIKNKELIKKYKKAFSSTFLQSLLLKREMFNNKKTHKNVLKYIRKLTKKYGGKCRYVSHISDDMPYYEYTKNEIVLLKNHHIEGESRRDIIRQFIHELAHLIQYKYMNSFSHKQDSYDFVDSTFKNQLRFERTAERLAFSIYKRHFRHSGIKFEKKDFNWYTAKHEKITLFITYEPNCKHLKNQKCTIDKECASCEYCLNVIG